jgi:hypothetical protein
VDHLRRNLGRDDLGGNHLVDGMKSNIIDIDVEVTHRTEKAVLVHIGSKEDAVWLPFSQIEIEPTGIPGIETVTLPEWLATEKGLI